MSEEIIRSLVDKIMPLHESRFADDDSELVAMYFLCKGDIIQTVVACPLQEPEQKNAVVAAIAQIADQHDCDTYLFTTEAWTLPQEKMVTHDGTSIAERTDRVEILMIEVGTKSGWTGMLICDMDRSQPGGVKLVRRELEIRDPANHKAVVMSRMNIFNSQIPGGPDLVEQMMASTRH